MAEQEQPESTQPESRYITLTPDMAYAALAARVCPACLMRKSSGLALCRSCFIALPLWLRGVITRGPALKDFVENYRIVLQTLRDASPYRRSRVLSSGRAWNFTTWHELKAAGYTQCENGHSRCSATKCRAAIVWFWTPLGHKIAIDLNQDSERPIPHAETCKDPQWLLQRQEQRALRTSAGRRKRGAA